MPISTPPSGQVSRRSRAHRLQRVSGRLGGGGYPMSYPRPGGASQSDTQPTQLISAGAVLAANTSPLRALIGAAFEKQLGGSTTKHKLFPTQSGVASSFSQSPLGSTATTKKANPQQQPRPNRLHNTRRPTQAPCTTRARPHISPRSTGVCVIWSCVSSRW